MEDIVYHAPLFNLFRNGQTCTGTHKFPEDIADIPESFFMSFFTREAESQGRSKKYPHLEELWDSLNGKKKYPMGDLVRMGKLKEVL